MRVLVACEFSGVVREAFRARGHAAWSCDLLPAEDGGPYHYQCDVRDMLSGNGAGSWDLMIAHPPCTYLCSMGIWWNHKRPERWLQTYSAALFVRELWEAPIPRIAIENPVGWLSTKWQKPSQVIHPADFGHRANKPTCLWLKNLPPLFPTAIVDKGEFYVRANGSRLSKWNHRASGTTKERARIASRTFPGIAAAMADQWGVA